MTDSSTFAPDWISPPGDTIEDLLEERGWTKAKFAERTGFTPKHINELVKGRVPISADAAERLSRVLGSTSDFWLVRDAQYQAACERQRANGRFPRLYKREEVRIRSRSTNSTRTTR